MGGAVSSGRDNNELVDNLKSGNYIRSPAVERVFRVLDRADYMSLEARDEAYKDLAWRSGPLHLSAPCIYSEVMEALDLKPGLSFLNVGSGTGYLSTLVGLIIGPSGISHGIESLSVVTDYANKKLSEFLESSSGTLEEFDFCIPKYYTGNGLCLAPAQRYDRVYCGAGVLYTHEEYFKQLIKVGGVLVMPLVNTLVQMRRVSEQHWTGRKLLNVSYALLRPPAPADADRLITLDQRPSSLAVRARAVVRAAVRAALLAADHSLREPPPRPARPQPRQICIPLDADTDEELNSLHELDEEGGAREMNALLSLVLSMSGNRAAGALRPDDSDSEHDDAAPAPPRPDPSLIVVDVAGLRRRRSPPSRAASPPASASDSEERPPPTTKRAKLDSGIGEGAASSSASPDHASERAADDRSERSPRSDRSDNDHTGNSDTDQGWGDSDTLDTASSSAEDAADSEGASSAPRRARRARRARSTSPYKTHTEDGGRRARLRRSRAEWAAGAAGAAERRRRARLAAAMQRALLSLPLPAPLRQYLNLGRPFTVNAHSDD